MTDPSLGAPLCLLAVASPLLEAGFEVKLVDKLTSPDFENVILRENRGRALSGHFDPHRPYDRFRDQNCEKDQLESAGAAHYFWRLAPHACSRTDVKAGFSWTPSCEARAS
jgi:hypothetical protein